MHLGEITVARIRYIKPEFFEDETIANVGILARLLYIGLFCQLDRDGVVEDSPRLFKAKIFPFDDHVGPDLVARALDELVSQGRLCRFAFDGKSYLFCPSFAKHQKFHPREHSKYKIPNEILAAMVRQPASNLPATVQPPSSRVGIGNGELELEQERGHRITPRTQNPLQLQEAYFSEDTTKIQNTLVEVFKFFKRTSIPIQVRDLLPKLKSYFETYEQFADEIASLAKTAETKSDPARYLESCLVGMIRTHEQGLGAQAS